MQIQRSLIVLLFALMMLPKAGAENFQYCIVVQDSLADLLQPLADWKTEKGVAATVVTTEWIYDHFVGRDRAERIRNFVVDRVAAWPDFRYLLLAGDVESVPPRYVMVENSYGVNDRVASDDYYTLLATNWDTDGDGRFGELRSPAMGGDEIDFTDYTLCVGRLPSDLRSEMAVMVDKIINYEKNPPAGDWNKNILFCGAVFNKSERSDCTNECDILSREFPSSLGFHPIKLYESLQQNYDDLTVANFQDHVNRGVSFISSVSHGTPEYFHWYNKRSGWTPGDYITADHALALTNGYKLPMVLACACATADLTHEGKCLGEAFMTAPRGGSIVYIGSTGYGLPQAYYFYGDFWGPARCRPGEAWQIAKQKTWEHYAMSPNSSGRYIYLQAILFGDPELRINVTDLTSVKPVLLPQSFGLSAFPNPFNSGCQIDFHVPQAGSVNVFIYNLRGRRVMDLIQNEPLPQGEHRVYWDACDSRGDSLPSGVYCVVMETQGTLISEKIVLLR